MAKPQASLRSDNCPIWIGMGVRQFSESVSDFIRIRVCWTRTAGYGAKLFKKLAADTGVKGACSINVRSFTDISQL